MDNQEKLAAVVKEQVEKETADYKANLEELRENNAKFLEENKEYREALEKLQNKVFRADGKLSTDTYIYKGFDPNHARNFKAMMPYGDAEQVAKAYLAKIYAAQGKAIDFASEMPQGYGSTVLGLAELSSSALSTMDVVAIDRPTFTAPVKATRETSDSQASATANTATSITADSITWTIDERIGSYAEVREDQLEDSLFDIVNGWVVPLQAEGIGQYVDAEVFNGTNSKYTTSIVDVTPALTASGTVAMAAAITYANLNTMFYHVEWERGLGNCSWFGSRAALKDVSALVDTNGFPIFQQVPINGRPSQTLMGSPYVITPVIANAPADGAMRLCFGDPSKYTIMLRGGLTNLVNPYIKMKEDVVQFIAKLRSDGNINDNATAASSAAWAVLARDDTP